MRRFEKVILFIIVAIGFAGAVCMFSLFYPLPFLSDWSRERLNLQTLWSTAFAGYTFLIIICFLILFIAILLFPNRSEFLVIKKEKGRLMFSKRTIESTAQHSFADMDGIHLSKVRAKIHKHPEKTKISVRLSLNQTDEMLALTETVQDRISSALQLSLGITVNSITVKATELSYENQIYEIKKKESGKDSRVE